MRRPELIFWILLTLIAAALSCNPPFDLTPPPPSATATATPTKTPTPIPTSTPTPTPDPAEWFSEATQAMRDGDYKTAVEIYRSLLALPLDEENAERAWLGLGTADLRDGDYLSATDTFRELLSSLPPAGGGERGEAKDAHFLLAEALVGAGDPLAAAGEYRVYLAAGTVITAYVNQSLGNALYTGGEYESAAQAYQDAIADAPDRAFEVHTREKLALAYVALEDYPAAVAQYDAILEMAQIRAYRARIEHQAAETLILAGETEAGYTRHLAVVETYPDEHYAYLSLVELVGAGRPVDDFLRGVVDYYGGAYGPAVEAFYRYINAYPETHSGDAHWYAGLSYLAAGSPNLAAGEFQVLIETHPENAHWGDAWMGLAEAYADWGRVEEAVETYRQFVETAPDHRRAPEALWEMAQLLERDGDLEAASEAYLDCRAQYPDSDYAPPALFRGGLQFYQLSRLADAAAAWDTLTGVYFDSAYYPATLLWLGKLRLAHGDPEAAAAVFEEASEADPAGYYGLRAADLAADPLSPLFPPARCEPDYDAGAAQAEAEEWLAGWLGLDDATDLGELAPTLVADPRLQRGLELWRLGRFEEAKGELEALRGATTSDALAQYQLALLFRHIGLYRSSILCAVRVVYLSPAETILEAPVFIARLAYPTYYEDLVLENARLNDLDPLLVFALVRQESLFESLATSTASAHGLMQVIPATGAQIAAELDWPPDYETADLYRPYISLRFGTYYLAQQRDRFEGRLDAALAGYNGGPANAQRWLESADDDPDLFLELITLGEPRLYLQRIKEHFAVYQALYGER
ncbi:MAG: transglycosylase SLT domain-containing protein [Anaerolineae bacterium]